MFSGLIGYRGTVVSIESDRSGARLRVACEGVAAEGVAAKDSVAIDGACLTATRVNGDVVTFDVVPETLARTTLGDLVPDRVVNVEYALRLGDRIGGHFVYGHVDATVRIRTLREEGQGKRMRLDRPVNFAGAIVEKGFVTIDGVSLTVADAEDDWFEVALIPETLARTTLGVRREGDRVNLEIDPFARYAAAILEAMHR